jgi:hypothetical protein
MSRTLHAFGLGVASENANGDILDVFFPAPKANISGGLADCPPRRIRHARRRIAQFSRHRQQSCW